MSLPAEAHCDPRFADGSVTAEVSAKTGSGGARVPALFAAARTAQDLAVRAPFGLSLIFLNVLLE